MKISYAVAMLTAACILCIGITGLSSEEGSPIVSDGSFLTNIDFPNYTLGTFFNDIAALFTGSEMSDLSLDEFGKFITDETFIGNISNGTLSLGTFTGSWVNLFFLTCIVISSLCIISAVVAGKKYKTI